MSDEVNDEVDIVQALVLQPGHYKTLIAKLECDRENLVEEDVLPSLLNGEYADAQYAAVKAFQCEVLIDWCNRQITMHPRKVSTEQMKRLVDTVCLSYRHDFGLLGTEERNKLRREAINWLHAWQKERL